MCFLLVYSLLTDSLKQLNNKTLNSANILMRADDWTIPIGSSLSQELSKLDTLLVKATGDGCKFVFD